MLKCRIGGKKKRIWIKAKGTARELVVESAAIVGNIYQNLNEKNPTAALEFKNTIIGVLLDPASPVWQKEEPKC